MKAKSAIDTEVRIMPQATELEEAVLGAILIEKTALETAMNILSPEMFYDKKNEIIFNACLSLEAERKPIDILTVIDQLRREGNIESAGGELHVAHISRKFISSDRIEYHSFILKDKYLHRKLAEVGLRTASLGFDETQEIDEAIASSNSEIESLQEAVIGKDESCHISEVAKKSLEQMHIRIANRRDGITPGIPTGFVDLDRITNGWQPEKFIVLAARPGVGKTSLAIKFARTAAKQGTPVAFFSLEMGKTELIDRMIIAEAQVSADAYNSGEIQMPEWSKAETAITAICRFPIIINDNPKVTVGNIVNKARLLKKQGKCGMVIIDYLQLITPNVRQNRNREQEISEISRLLKIHAKELKVPFIVLCQMNREYDKENKSRIPRLSDLRESGSIEQDSDIVIFIDRPGMNGKKVQDQYDNYLENLVILYFKKHRGGKIGTIKLKHNDSMTDFYDWDNMGQDPQMPAKWEYRNYYKPEERDDFPF
jgi:replicative DNA helicase